MRPRALLAIVAAACLAIFSSADTRGESDLAERAQALIVGLDFDEAREALRGADPEDPRVAIERARLAVYELDCDGAATILARPDLQGDPAAEQLADIARGCQRVTAALVVDRDQARGIEIRWQDEHDRPLAPLLLETVAAAREALSRDLGVDWPHPTRVVVVRDLLSLSAMTGLPYKSAQTTGTVAVAKWGRVTLLSPRASRHGYVWRDTVAHELTHLAVTRASRDRAPLWLQEGVAKREETRWRAPGPFDDRPPVDGIVERGQKLKLTLPLDKLGPSIAMLPSADAAMVAFAEVTSFVRFYAREAGAGALPRLLAALKDGKDPDQALRAASGADLKGWDQRWRADLAAHAEPPPPALFGLGSDHRSAAALTALRDHSRLAELLMGRDHPSEALTEVDRALGMTSGRGGGTAGAGSASGDDATQTSQEVMLDPSVRWLRARALEGAGRREDGAALVRDPAAVSSPYAPWWAIRGRWARMEGRDAEAETSFSEAVSIDPFDPEATCETIDPRASPEDAEKAQLCELARRGGAPPFDE